jgi:uncharacterized protein with PIN domain
VPVAKETILARLEPLTKKYYESFHACKLCGRIYWAGSHQEKIVDFIHQVLKTADQENPL